MENIALALDSRDIGGIETHVLILAEALIAAGHRATIVRLADHGPHPMDGMAARQNVPVGVLSADGPGLTGWLKQSGATLLHTHGYKAGILGRLCRLQHRLPVVSTFHNGDRGKGKLALYTALDRLTSRLSRNIAVSDQIAAQLPGGVEMIDNFVTMPQLRGQGTGHVVAFVGRLSHEKGPDMFIELARRLPGTDFVMFGDGPMRQELAAAASPNVTMAGNVPGMAAHWPAISLLVMPSRQEGLPMAALEAMANGVPVAAFEVGGLPGLISEGRNGYLAPQGDLDRLTRLVSDYVSAAGTHRSALSAGATETIRERYSVAAQLPKVLSVYGAALGRPL